ncbi:MAG: hypothetical protein GWP63_08775 [Haliea sp.]|jgi:hypothetical protein|nr:hypothetical protein [Haliea sp.]
MIETQSSQLLPALFEYIDEDRRLTVLHLGPALPETVEFFSRYRSKLFFADLFAELPLVAEEEGELSLEQQLAASLELPADIRFDLCLFWDLFNFLDGPAIAALQAILRPRVHPSTLGHGFTSHNARVRPPDRTYAIREVNELVTRALASPRPGYAARGQGPLKNALDRFEFGRTVLLPDKRLEFLLSVKR